MEKHGDAREEKYQLTLFPHGKRIRKYNSKVNSQVVKDKEKRGFSNTF